MTELYRCKGCGETDTIAEISLVPRVVVVRPPESTDSGLEYLSRGWGDECYWEAETVLGYGCTNERCQYWQGDIGAPEHEEFKPGAFVFMGAPALKDIADTVSEVPA